MVALTTCLAALTAGSMTGAGAQSGSTQGVSDTEIKVGGLGDSAAFFTEATMGLGAQARFARANETGELPGKRKINMVAWGDIKADSATSVQEERRLIEQEGVFAIVPTSSVYTSAQVPNQRHVPVFGFGIAPAYCSALNAPNYFFGFDGCVVPPADTKTVGDNTSLMIEAAETGRHHRAGHQGTHRHHRSRQRRRQAGHRRVCRELQGQRPRRRVRQGGDAGAARGGRRLHALRVGRVGDRARHHLLGRRVLRLHRPGQGVAGGELRGDVRDPGGRPATRARGRRVVRADELGTERVGVDDAGDPTDARRLRGLRAGHRARATRWPSGGSPPTTSSPR